jgi:hypothetical protein
VFSPLRLLLLPPLPPPPLPPPPLPLLPLPLPPLPPLLPPPLAKPTWRLIACLLGVKKEPLASWVGSMYSPRNAMYVPREVLLACVILPHLTTPPSVTALITIISTSCG